MTTDKELAEILRTAAGDAVQQKEFDVAEYLARRAEFLDPPKPTWPEGTVAWVTRSDGVKHVAQRINGEWVDMLYKDGSPSCAVYNSDVTKVEPLRVLGDDEIAVGRGLFTGRSAQARRYADELQAAGFGVASLMYNRIADARDAETGAAK